MKRYLVFLVMAAALLAHPSLVGAQDTDASGKLLIIYDSSQFHVGGTEGPDA